MPIDTKAHDLARRIGACTTVLALATCTPQAPTDTDPRDADASTSSRGSTAGDDDPSSSETGGGGPAATGRCGDGVVGPDEQCDPRPPASDAPCDERCRVPGATRWVLESPWLRDVAVGSDRLLACSPELVAIDLDDPESVDRPLASDVTCDRVAVAPNGDFATLDGTAETAAHTSVIRRHAADGAVRWSVPDLPFRRPPFGRPDIVFPTSDRIIASGDAETSVVGTGGSVLALDEDGDELWRYADLDPGVSENRLDSLATAGGGQVIVSGSTFPPAVGGQTLLWVVDDGERILDRTWDFFSDDYRGESITSVAVVDDESILAVVLAPELLLAAFDAEHGAPTVRRTLAPSRGYGGLASHPSGLAALAYISGSDVVLELVDATGEPSWSTRWTPTVTGSDGITVAVDERGDVYVALLGMAGEIRAFASPR